MRPPMMAAATVLGLSTLALATGLIQDWAVLPVDTGPDTTGWPVSIAVDSANRPHAAYYYRTATTQEGTGYAVLEGGTWSLQQQFPGLSEAELILGGDDTPHIAAYDKLNNCLQYFTRSGPSWTGSVLGTGYMAYHASLAFDSAGDLHAAWADSSSHTLKYSTLNGMTWTSENVLIENTLDNGPDVRLALDSVDWPHFAWCGDDHSIKYAKQTPSGWAVENLGQGWIASLVIGLDDRATLAYQGYSTGVVVRDYEAGIWTSQTLEPGKMVSRGCALALDHQGNMRLAYIVNDPQASLYRLKYAQWTDTGWNIQQLYTWPTGVNGPEDQTMVLDASDNVHILFATSLGDVYYAFGQVPEAGTLSLLLLGGLALVRRRKRSASP